MKIETRSAPLCEPVCSLWPVKSAPTSPWIGLTKGVVFCDSSWVVQTQNETLFIYFHSCAGLESYVEMTQFHIVIVLAKDQPGRTMVYI